MNITQESTGNLTATIRVSLQENDYIDDVNKQLSDYRKKANMPGFRPGKVPMGIVKKMYGNSVMVEEINKKLSEALNNYIVENKINVLGNPIPNTEKTTDIDFANNKEFDFFFDIGLAPEFELKLSKDIKVPLYSIKLSDKQLDEAIEDVKVRFGTDENPETLESGDSVQGKLTEVDTDGNPIENGVSNNAFIKFDDLQLKTIQNKFIGLKSGDKIVFNPMKATKDASKVGHYLNIQDENDDKIKSDYELEVDKIVRTAIPELNEEFFKKVFPSKEVKTEKDFRKEIEDDITRQLSRDTERQFLGDTIKELIKISKIELPDEFLKRWLLESNEGKITAEQLEEQYDSYSRTFKWQLLESELMKDHREEIEVTEQEIKDKVASYFQSMGGTDELASQLDGIINHVLSNPEEKQRVQNDLQDEKLIKFFKNQITPQKKSVTKDKFIEIASKID